jgi:stress response protein SCP2
VIRHRFRARLSWDVTASPESIRLHLAAFLVEQDEATGRYQVPVTNPYYSVHHDNDRSKDGSTVRHGRQQHGHAGRDETITVTVPRISARVDRVVFVAYLQDPKPGHTFANLRGGVIRFYEMPPFLGAEEDEDLDPEKDYATAVEFGQHQLNNDYDATELAVIVGELHREPGESHAWLYQDLGLGRGDLAEVGGAYGVIFR